MARNSRTSSPTTSRLSLLDVQVILLCAVAFISPLIAGKLTAIPDFATQLLVLLAALVWVVRARQQVSIILPYKWILGLAVAFFGFLALSAWHSASLYLTIRELLNFSAYLLIFLMIVGLGQDRRSVYLILASLGVSSLVVGMLGVKEYILSGAGGWRTFSTFFNPDFLAGFTAMMLPIALGWYLSRAAAGVSAVAGLVVLYLAGTTLITGSRFGALSAVIGVVVFLVLAAASGSFRKSQALRIVVLIIPLLVVHLALSRPLTARVGSTKAEAHSGGFRIKTWIGTAHMLAAHPVHGTGLGTFAIAYPKYAVVGYTKLAHNTYLQLAGEAGPASAGLLILLLASSTLPAMVVLVRRRVLPDSQEVDAAATRRVRWMPETGLMLSGLTGGACASIVRNLVDSDWYVTAIGISFWMILGASVILTDGTRARSTKFSTRGALAAGIVLGLVVTGTLAMLSGENTAESGELLWCQNPVATIDAYKQAMKLDPLNADYHRKLGMAYLAIAEQTSQQQYWEDAVQELEKAISLEPGNPKNHYQLGKVYDSYGVGGSTIKAYRAALEWNPNAVEAMVPLARAYDYTGQHPESVKVWKRMVEVENSPYEQIKAVPELVTPEYVFAHAELGHEDERQGDKAGAVREYRSALDRIARYEVSQKGMKDILDANNRRDPRMEQAVHAVRLDVEGRLKSLSGIAK